MPLCSRLPLRHASHSARPPLEIATSPSTRNALASRPVLTLLQRPVASGCAHRLVWLLSLIGVAPLTNWCGSSHELVWLLSLIGVAPLTPPTPPPSSLPPSAPSSFTMPRTAPLLLALRLWPARARRPQPAPRRRPRPCPPSLAWARCPPPPHERRPGHRPPPTTRRTGRDSFPVTARLLQRLYVHQPRPLRLEPRHLRREAISMHSEMQSACTQRATPPP